MKQFLWGMLAMASLVASLCFMRYWRLSRDRLFVFVALGFAMLGANWFGLVAIDPADESRHLVYLMRLLAFGFILIGIIDKNRRGARW